jgi:dynactin complex subunit
LNGAPYTIRRKILTTDDVRPNSDDRKRLIEELRRMTERLYSENQRLRERLEAYETQTLEDK